MSTILTRYDVLLMHPAILLENATALLVPAAMTEAGLRLVSTAMGGSFWW